MWRVFTYMWMCLALGATNALPDTRPVLCLRGLLVRWCFRRCGRNLQIGANVRIQFAPRIEIGDDVYFAQGAWIQGVGGITCEDQVMLGPYTCLATNNHTRADRSYRFGPPAPRPITLRRGCWTGAHVTITAGVTVGAGAACAAGAVVTKDVPDDAIVGGVPARQIGAAADNA